MQDPFGLHDKTILVSGASSGIGRTIAIKCAKYGARIIITARNKERLAQTAQSLSGKGHSVVSADLCDDNEIDALVNELPLLNGIVNNAGIANPQLFSFTKKEDLHTIFQVNLFSSVELIKKIIKKKKLAKDSSIVFVSSISGSFITSPGGSIYGASKSAIDGLAKNLALELSGKGIRVNTVNPGVIQTDIFTNSSISQADLEKDKKRYPLGRFGRTDDVAYAIVFLLSDASSWITGTNLKVDGGYTLL